MSFPPSRFKRRRQRPSHDRATGGEVTEEGVAEGPDSDPWMTCSVRTESLIVRLLSTEVKQLDSTEPFSLFPKAVSCSV